MSSSTTVQDKFVGCMLGSLVGDCFGCPFELRPARPEKVATFLTRRLAVQHHEEVSTLNYTDDTEMALSVADSLTACNGFDAKDMSKRFVAEYLASPPVRNYGAHVRGLFLELKKAKGGDVFGPAGQQFGGQGSLGNGAAMRTHPVALYCHGKDQDTLFDICRQTARITHAHMDGYNGAILQTLAIRQALNADSGLDLDSADFLGRLRAAMVHLESGRSPATDFPSFCCQIDNITSALADKDGNPSDLGRKLGTDETAPFSVPAAIYCFLRSQKPVEAFPTDNPFLRALYLAISLGGDTDTVACMACAISGAFHGRKAVPEVLYRQCESWTELLDKTNKMAALVGVQP